LRSVWPRPADDKTLVGQTILAARTLHFLDPGAAPLSEHATARATLALRTALDVPMLREGQPIGVIVLARSEVRGFSEHEIALVQTFADQAVIAIENVRLFKELQQKNEALTVAHAQVTESLEQQTATAEILGVISGSPTDIQPVFAAVLDRALTLCERSEEHTSELQSLTNLVCRLLLEKKKLCPDTDVDAD